MERFLAELEKRDGLLTEFNEEDCIHHNEPAAYVVFYQMAISAKILRLPEMFSPRYEYYMVTGISFVGGRQVQSLQT